MFQPLIGAQALAELVAESSTPVVIVDCRHQLKDPRWGQEAYQLNHIPQARFAHLDNDLSGVKTGKNGRHPLPTHDALIALFSRLGISDETTVVAYDQGDMMYAARLWWLLRLMGHDKVTVLDGGYTAWIKANLPTTQVQTDAEPTTFHAGESLVKWVCTDDMLANIDTQQYQVVDGRGADRFRGENETIDPVAGHIPHAKNRCFTLNLAANGLMKPVEQLKAEWAEFGDATKLIHQCGSGVSACVNILALAVIGEEDTLLYPGSWSEWCADSERPVE